MKKELERKRAEVNEFEGLVSRTQLRGVNSDLYEKNASLTANVNASEESNSQYVFC